MIDRESTVIVIAHSTLILIQYYSSIQYQYNIMSQKYDAVQFSLRIDFVIFTSVGSSVRRSRCL